MKRATHMKYLDRNLQKEILATLSEFYPKSIDLPAFERMLTFAQSEHKLAANLFYMEEYGLLISGLQPTSDDSFFFAYKEIKITAKGMDLLADDGGIAAILRAVPSDTTE